LLQGTSLRQMVFQTKQPTEEYYQGIS
jgi:hypothetical protein